MKKPHSHSRYRYILRIEGVLNPYLYYPTWTPLEESAQRMTWRQALRAAHRLSLSTPVEITRVNRF